MKNRITIKDKVLHILRTQGSIDNFYAIDNRITTRLSDVIFQLVQSGQIQLDEERSGYLAGTKNWDYVVRPFQKKEYFVNGILVASKFV